MGRVEGKVALVTGGASGLGRATAIMLAKEGAKVAVTDINEVGGKAVVAEIGDAAVFFRHDVTNEGEWQLVLAATVKAFGKLNVLVNSAGIGMSKTVEELTFEE
jgi:3(or 17)beta-hydroxysteroid dehydrogenase